MPYSTTFFSKKFRLCFLSVLVLSLNAYSQIPVSSHYKAAENLISAMALQANYKSSLQAVVMSQSKTVPEEQRQKFIAAMLEFFDKFATWDKMKATYAKLYMDEFSEAELNEIAVFYRTPVGIKLMEKSPVLMSKGMQFGQAMVLDHQTEMQAILKKYFEN